jgi:hypothetical protein
MQIRIFWAGRGIFTKSRAKTMLKGLRAFPLPGTMREKSAVIC